MWTNQGLKGTARPRARSLEQSRQADTCTEAGEEDHGDQRANYAQLLQQPELVVEPPHFHDLAAGDTGHQV
jgi:hypothetical protein